MAVDDHLFFTMARGNLDCGDSLVFEPDTWLAVVPWWYRSDYKSPEEWFTEYGLMYGLDVTHNAATDAMTVRRL